MAKAKRTFRACTALPSIIALLYSTALMIRYLNWLEQRVLPGLFVALAGVAGVLIGLTCSRTEDRSLYLWSRRGEMTWLRQRDTGVWCDQRSIGKGKTDLEDSLCGEKTGPVIDSGSRILEEASK